MSGSMPGGPSDPDGPDIARSATPATMPYSPPAAPFVRMGRGIVWSLVVAEIEADREAE